MSDQDYLGRGKRIVTARMTDGKLGRALEKWENGKWNTVQAVSWSAASSRVVICKDELDRHLTQIARRM